MTNDTHCYIYISGHCNQMSSFTLMHPSAMYWNNLYLPVGVFLFQTSGPENRVNTKDFKDADWLFPETTKNFTKLPLQYRVIKSFIIIGQKNFEDIIKAYRLIYSKWCNRLLINVAICINWYKHDIPIFKNNIQTCNHPTSIEIINISPTGLLCSVPSKLWPASDPVQPRGGGAEVQRPLLRLLQ